MSNSSQKSWSDNPYAPQIPYSLYFSEKSYFSGFLVGAIFYGIVIVLFFQCMGALFHPVNRARGGVRWGLVTHTTAMFLFVTIYTAATLDLQSISFIDNREYPGIEGTLPSGPVGYQLSVYSKAIGIIPQVMYLLNNWLADGFLLYRCCIIYSMNYWMMIISSLMYLAAFATGIGFVYQGSRPNNIATGSPGVVAFGASYFAVTFSLNVLLTLMIVIRLVVHRRNLRNAMGASGGTGGLYKTIVTILVESFALYAVTFLLFVISWGTGSYIQYVFLQVLAQTQVMAPFLIVLRLADRSALTSSTVASGNVETMHFRSQEKSTVDIDTMRNGAHPTESTDASDEDPSPVIEKRIGLNNESFSGSSRSDGFSKV